MSILDDIKKPDKNLSTLDPVVFINALKAVNVDYETINDCMLEEPEIWPSLVNYFEMKHEQNRRSSLSEN